MHRRPRHASIGQEATRIADHQLTRAMVDLHRAGAARGHAVHDARRRIRRVRALLRVLRPRLSADAYVEANRRLRALNRRLASIASGPTVLGTLTRLAARPDARQARPAIDAIKAALVKRAERTGRTAAVAHMLQRAETTLAVERARIGTWDIEQQRLPIAAGLEHSRRQAAKAMTRAIDSPTAARERAWRRSTAQLWSHVQLLEPSNRALRLVRDRLEALDVCLDESHNVRILERILMTEALASRQDTATALRLLRHYQTELRARAFVQGQEALRVKRSPAT